jgi:hypothetical protein
VVALRADMDALPVTEATNLPFASKVPGKMHACGHDAHTVIALGVAEVLHQLKSEVPGTVKFIFQPAEETLAGAQAMIVDGVLDNPKMDLILGYHNWPLLDADPLQPLGDQRRGANLLERQFGVFVDLAAQGDEGRRDSIDDGIDAGLQHDDTILISWPPPAPRRSRGSWHWCH